MFSLQLCFILLCANRANAVSQNVPMSLPRFATKSSYNLSAEIDIFESFYDHENKTKPQKCVNKFTPLHVTAIFRHGTRTPGLDDVETVRLLLDKLRKASMQEQLCIKLNDTLNKFPLDDDKNLVETGIIENIHLGYVFGSRFLKLFSNATGSEVDFYVTSKKRTVDSFAAFLKGFRNGSTFQLEPKPIIRDDLLRFFDYCDKYIDSVDKNKSAIIEAKLYMELKVVELNHLVESATNTKNLNITSDEFDSLLDIAGTEDAILNTRNWLKIMSEETLDILNYVSDLEDYWKKGPGYAISYEQSCVLVSEIFKVFDRIVAGERSKKGAFYFSHAETLLPVFGLLGFFIDDPPLYHNNSNIHKDRAFKTTRICPFASNIAFILHECEDEMFIEVLFKEHPLTWPACGNSICPYKKIRSYFSKYIDECNFQEVCKEDKGPRNVEL